MKLTYAQFNFQIRDKSYAVQMGVQSTAANTTTVSITAIHITDAGNKRVILSRVEAGRQIVSPSNAERILREALVGDGILKPRKKSEPKKKAETPVGQYVQALAEQEKKKENPIGRFVKLLFKK